MDTLPPELINIIATYIQKITDKRQFTQTCITYNNITKPIIKNQETTIKIKYFEYPSNYCMEKFTLELCNDSYFNKIQNHYLSHQNEIIVRALTIYGQIELLELAMDNGCKLFKEIDEDMFEPIDIDNINSCSHAVIGGNIDMLMFVRSHGCKWDENTLELAAKVNQFNMLKLIKQNGCEINDCVSLRVAENGNVEIMNWLIDNNCIIDNLACEFAADYGHLKMLKLLKKNNCYWDSDTCLAAATGGKLDCFQWLVENGCPLNISHTYSESARFNQIHIIKWMQSKGYIFNSETCIGAIHGKNFELLKWLVKEGCELNSNVYFAIKENIPLWPREDWDFFFDSVEEKENWKLSCDAHNIDINNKYTELLQWLKDNGCPTH